MASGVLHILSGTKYSLRARVSPRYTFDFFVSVKHYPIIAPFNIEVYCIQPLLGNTIDTFFNQFCNIPVTITVNPLLKTP